MDALFSLLGPLLFSVGGVGGAIGLFLKFGNRKIGLIAVGALLVGGPAIAHSMAQSHRADEANKKALQAQLDKTALERQRADSAVAGAAAANAALDEMTRLRDEQIELRRQREDALASLRTRNRQLEAGLDTAISTWMTLEAEYADDQCLASTDYTDLADGMRQLLDHEMAAGTRFRYGAGDHSGAEGGDPGP